MYDTTITRENDADSIQAVFAAEDKSFPNDRAAYTVTADDDLTIRVEATDTKAFRAVMNSITTILDIYDRSKRIT